MKIIKRYLSYVHRKDRGNTRLCVIWDNNRVYVSTGVTVDPAHFDNGRCRPGSFHGAARFPAHKINRVLSDLEAAVDDFFYNYEMRDAVPTAAEFRARFSAATVKRSTFADVWEQFIKEGVEMSGWSANTVKSVRNVLNILEAYKPELSVSDLTPAMLSGFIVYQQKNRLRRPKSGQPQKGGAQPGYANNVVAKNCRVVRWFLRWAARQGLVDASLESACVPGTKSIPRPVLFLTWPELQRFAAVETAPGTPERHARDLFLLMCFTSLRYSDAVSLKKANVTDGHIEVVTRKTAKPLRIELNDHSRAILSRYAATPGDRAMPYMGQYHLNAHIKRIARRAGINTPVMLSQYYGTERIDRTVEKWEKMSSHCGRRTFVCNALALGIPAETVMKWTGHSSHEAMRPYIEIADEARRAAMSVFNTMPMGVPDGGGARVAHNVAHETPTQNENKTTETEEADNRTNKQTNNN